MLCLLPWHGLPVRLPTGGCPAEELPCWSTTWQGNAQCPRLRSALAEGQDTSSIPQHHCLFPATDPRCSCPRTVAGAPLLSPSSAQAVPGLVSCPEQPQHSGITPTPAIPICPSAGETWSQPCPVPQGPSLTGWQWLHHGHLDGLRCRAALLRSPVLLPGHPGLAWGSLLHSAESR